VAIEGLVGGLAFGLVMPSLLRVFAVWRANRSIAGIERRLIAGSARPPAPVAQAEAPVDEAPTQQSLPATDTEPRPDEAAAQQPPVAPDAEPAVEEAPAEPPPDEAAG
jgi:hypothetical protein